MVWLGFCYVVWLSILFRIEKKLIDRFKPAYTFFSFVDITAELWRGTEFQGTHGRADVSIEVFGLGGSSPSTVLLITKYFHEDMDIVLYWK